MAMYCMVAQPVGATIKAVAIMRFMFYLRLKILTCMLPAL